MKEEIAKRYVGGVYEYHSYRDGEMVGISLDEESAWKKARDPNSKIERGNMREWISAPTRERMVGLLKTAYFEPGFKIFVNGEDVTSEYSITGIDNASIK